MRAVGRWLRRWGVLTLSLFWLVDEVYEGLIDPSPDAWPLTRVIVTYLPPWVYMPLALLLAVWLPAHLWRAGRELARMRRGDG